MSIETSRHANIFSASYISILIHCCCFDTTTAQHCAAHNMPGREQAASCGLLLLLVLQLLSLHMQPCAAQQSSAIVPLAELAGGLMNGFTDLSSLGGPSFAIDSGLLSWMQSALLGIFDNLGDDGSGSLQGWMKSSNPVATGAVAAGSFAAGAVVGGSLGASKGPLGPLPPHLPPPLPPLPSGHPLAPWTKKHDLPLRLLADKWGAALTEAQFNPGLQGFLQLLGLADEQEALVKWMCILYPKWTNALLPQPLQDVRDSYCVRALPAAAVSKLLQGPSKPPGPLGLPPGGGFGKKPGPLPMPGPMGVLG